MILESQVYELCELNLHLGSKKFPGGSDVKTEPEDGGGYFGVVV